MKSVKSGFKAYNTVFQTNIFSQNNVSVSQGRPPRPWWRLPDTCYICAVVWPDINV